MKSTSSHRGSRAGSNGVARQAQSASTIDTLVEDLATIRRDLVALAASGVESITDGAKATLHSAAEVAKRAGEAVKEKAEGAHEAVGQFAGRRPLTTILIGAGVGIVGWMIVSRMWRR